MALQRVPCVALRQCDSRDLLPGNGATAVACRSRTRFTGVQGTRESQPCKIFLFTQADAEKCQAKKPCQRCDELELLRVDAGQWLRGGASWPSGADTVGSAQARTR